MRIYLLRNEWAVFFWGQPVRYRNGMVRIITPFPKRRKRGYCLSEKLVIYWVYLLVINVGYVIILIESKSDGFVKDERCCHEEFCHLCCCHIYVLHSQLVRGKYASDTVTHK